MNSAAIVFGGIVVGLSAVVAAATEQSSRWSFVGTFVLSAITLVGLAGMGAMLGIIYREALKALP